MGVALPTPALPIGFANGNGSVKNFTEMPIHIYAIFYPKNKSYLKFCENYPSLIFLKKLETNNSF